MREQMPNVAAFIDQMREVFGRDAVDPSIREGMRGKPTFWAKENGYEIGTPIRSELEVVLFGPDRHERTEQGQLELLIKKQTRKSKWRR